jgi:hypothetical protein
MQWRSCPNCCDSILLTLSSWAAAVMQKWFAFYWDPSLSCSRSKGIEIGRECRTYDVCNPQAASEALAPNMGASAVLPCRISVFSEGDKTILATVKPTDLL